MKYNPNLEKEMDMEVARYKKKTKSNTSKSFNKSSHKHEYKDCLFKDEKTGNIWLGSYCVTCGKIGNVTKATEERDGLIYLLTDEEILSNKKYKKRELITVMNIWDKYIPINE